MSARLIASSGLGSWWANCDLIVEREDGRSLTLNRTGTYEELFAMQPRRGDTLDGFEGYPVQRSTITRKPGGMAKMTVLLGGNGQDANDDEEGVVSRRVKLGWREIQAPLTDGFYQAFGSSIMVSLLNAWRAEPDAALKAQYKFRNPVMYGSNDIYTVQYEETALEGDAIEAAKRMECDVQSYSVFMPLVFVAEQRSKEPIARFVPQICTGAVLKAKYNRRYIPLRAPGNVGSLYSYMLVKYDVDETDKGWSVSKEYLGALPPTGLLGVLWQGKAFDPKYYPDSQATIDAVAKQQKVPRK